MPTYASYVWHGQTANGKTSPEYRSFTKAKYRCENPNNDVYHHYGGRGIRFLFTSFSQFIECVGPRPGPEYSIDRFPNNDGNYEPGNVRWATRHQQMMNRRITQSITLDGVTRTLLEWAKVKNLRPAIIRKRMHSGKTPEDILNVPSKRELVPRMPWKRGAVYINGGKWRAIFPSESPSGPKSRSVIIGLAHMFSREQAREALNKILADRYAQSHGRISSEQT